MKVKPEWRGQGGAKAKRAHAFSYGAMQPEQLLSTLASPNLQRDRGVLQRRHVLPELTAVRTSKRRAM